MANPLAETVQVAWVVWSYPQRSQKHGEEHIPIHTMRLGEEDLVVNCTLMSSPRLIILIIQWN